jgi:dihydropteroate synthase
MSVRILSIHAASDLEGLFQGLKVDPYGTRIMLPKAIPYCVRLDSISCICANILKQEMLSLGADAALPRDVLTGKAKTTDCVLIANRSQLSKLVEKLQKQPFGLAKLGLEIKGSLNNYEKQTFDLTLRQYRIRLGSWPHIMGIMNLTPDSFSSDGLLAKKCDTGYLVEYAQAMVRDGADIIDIGGESSRPGAKAVPAAVELKRVIPAIKAITRRLKVPVSIDTYKPEVARAAFDSGACMVNDISGLRSKDMIKAAVRYKAGVVIMHMQGSPRNMQKNPHYNCVTAEVISYLKNRVTAALDSGVSSDKIIIDPGIGFGKTLEHNLSLLRNLEEFKILGLPIMVGTSRKGFIGKITNTEAQSRVPGTIATCVLAVSHGCHIVRVHDIKQVKQALLVTKAVLND